MTNVTIFGRPFVKRLAACCRSVVCLSCPVCDVGVLWPNGWMDQDETWWRGGRPRSRPYCVRWGPSSSLPKGAQPPIFCSCIVAERLDDQDVTWHGGRPQPRPHCVRWGQLPPKGGTAPNFRSMSVVANGWIDQDATWCGGRPRPRRHCVR